ncbi:MAG: agmatine deiminase [Bacteroidia bacterium]
MPHGEHTHWKNVENRSSVLSRQFNYFDALPLAQYFKPTMKNFKLIALVLFGFSGTAFAQFLPHAMTAEEYHMLPLEITSSRGFTTPPTVPIRTSAEWEEIDGLCIRWEGNWSRSILREIVRNAKLECTVYILTENENSVTSYLSSGGVNTTNVVFVDDESDSIWMRDYGQWNVYENDVEDLLFVDWIYNRPRPDDDIFPTAISDLLGIPLYETTQSPTDLVNTGGNFMVDGFGTAFASELILEENEPGNPYNVSVKSEAQIDQIMEDFMGIDRYIKMETLPYDGIHHIDMHMKLLDEETLLVGQYPQGVADGPQIEANIQYVLNNFNSVYGTPYDVIRIPMPPEGGDYPDNFGDYRTYTNSVFVNNTILVPIYEEEWDTTALRIYREALPGYKVVGIDCNEIIGASGALHCITKAVGNNDPLLISHQPLDDLYYVETDYQVDALVQHADDISDAQVYYTADTLAGFSFVNMTLTNASTNTWTGHIPYQQGGDEVFYYIHAEANNGKEQVRPMPAPQGWWKFDVLNVTGIEQHANAVSIFPNPSNGSFTVDLNSSDIGSQLSVIDPFGRTILDLGTQQKTIQQYKLNLSTGIYMLRVVNEAGARIERLVVD